jgi:cytochrome oxidase assembly protein ShyY1
LKEALRPRWWPWHLLVLAVAATFVWLGFWQLDRHGQLQERNALLEARLADAPRPYRQAAGTFDPDAPAGADDGARYRPVVAEGRYAAEHEVLLRGRTLEGAPGFHVLTPLIVDGGGQRAVLVNRGWIPMQRDDPRLPDASPPEGPVVLEGRLMPEDDPPTGALAGLTPRDPADGPLEVAARADVERLAPQMPFALDPFVIELVRTRTPEVPTGPEHLPVPLEAPAPEAGPHLSYTLQWWFFAAVALVGYALLLRQRLAAAARRD